jgi:uncharacterized membrane protein
MAVSPTLAQLVINCIVACIYSCQQTVTCRWIDESVSLEIPASKEEAYGLYSQLDQHTRWSPWLNDVTYDKDQGVSTWVSFLL